MFNPVQAGDENPTGLLWIDGDPIGQPIRGTQREYSSKPLKHSIVERISVFKR